MERGEAERNGGSASRRIPSPVGTIDSSEASRSGNRYVGSIKMALKKTFRRLSRFGFHPQVAGIIIVSILYDYVVFLILDLLQLFVANVNKGTLWSLGVAYAFLLPALLGCFFLGLTGTERTLRVLFILYGIALGTQVLPLLHEWLVLSPEATRSIVATRIVVSLFLAFRVWRFWQVNKDEIKASIPD